MEEEIHKRIKPHSEEAEQSVIGGMFLNTQKIPEILEIIPKGSYFYNRTYGSIYDAIAELNREGRSVDSVTVQDKLREMNVPEEVSSMEFIGGLIVSVPTSAHLEDYARIVMEKAVLRELVKVTEGITEDCYQSKKNYKDLMEDAEKEIFRVVQKQDRGDIVPIGEVIIEALESIDRAARITGDVTGLASGFIDLDHKTAGFQKGNLVLVAARPAMGKTSFVLSMARDIAFRQRKTVAMFSLEMSKQELVNRLLSMDSKVDSQKFKTGNLTERDWESLVESGSNMGECPLYIDDTSKTVKEMRSKCRQLKLEKNLQMIIIDYLQLMDSTGRTDSRQQEISEISRALKLMAKELEIPVVALSQLSRAVEGRTDHRPMLSDLRESGAIEQDADMVMFIYRDEVYNSDTEKKNIAEIIIAKHRSGPIGTIELAWLPEYTMFHNLGK